MAVGISVANSILLVSFAEHARHKEKDVCGFCTGRSDQVVCAPF